MTAAAPEHLSLASEFPSATREQWLALVQQALKGRTFDQALVAKTADGLTIAPLHARCPDSPSLPMRAPGTRWQIIQRMDHPDPVAANAQALEDLAAGANGLTLVMAGSLGARGYGLAATPDAIERALDGVHLDAGIAIDIDYSSQAPGTSPLTLTSLAMRRGMSAEAVDFRLGFDPLGKALFAGGFENDPLGAPLAVLARALADLGFRRNIVCADGRIVHDAGGTEAQELAYVIGSAVAYLRALVGAGFSADDARRMIAFRMTADADQFLTIAKFRALRMLWARIEESCGLTPSPAFISAETAWRTMTRSDPATNILRATIATFAAGVGGADAITVLPFTAARGLPDGFARRLARNTHLILLDEAGVARVADPTAGTGWSEDLSDQLCRAAWSLFQEIEAAGGMMGALQRGLLQERVAKARGPRERAIATRRTPLIGANAFPDLGELTVTVLNVARATSAPPAVQRPIAPMSPMRLAEPFEALRDASDRMLAASGHRPRVFLANLGTPAAFMARATFAKDLFEAGGIEAIDNDGFKILDEMVAAYAASSAPLACLCGTDDAYAREAVAAAAALKAAGARHLYLAGQGGEHEAALREAGIGTFVFTGCDAINVLWEALRK